MFLNGPIDFCGAENYVHPIVAENYTTAVVLFLAQLYIVLCGTVNLAKVVFLTHF